MNIGSKLGIYDFLTMFVSGVFVLLFVYYVPDASECLNPCVIQQNKVACLVTLTVAFLAGVIFHRFIEWVRGRHCFTCLKKSIERIRHRHCSKCKKKCLRKFKWRVCSCWRSITIARRVVFRRNNISAIEYAYSTIFGEKLTSMDVLSAYYLAYENMATKPSSSYGSVVHLEEQEAFLRNMFNLLLLHGILFVFWGKNFLDNLLRCCCDCCNSYIVCSCNLCIVKISIAVLLLFILIARYQTQMKIYLCVWESKRVSDLISHPPKND